MNEKCRRLLGAARRRDVGLVLQIFRAAPARDHFARGVARTKSAREDDNQHQKSKHIDHPVRILPQPAVFPERDVSHVQV